MKKGIGLAIAGMLLFVGCSHKKTPEDVVKAFVEEAGIKKDFDGYTKYATKETVDLIKMSLSAMCDVKKKGYDECYKEMLKQSKDDEIKKVEIVNTKKIDDNHVVVTIKEYTKNGKVSTAKFDVFKIDGKWKIGIKK